MTEAVKKVYEKAGVGSQAPSPGKGIHTIRAHKCVARYLAKGFSKDEAWKRCMGGLGSKLAVKKSHRRS